MTRRINLALQGGGAHGAFTWGVLDRLLEEDDIEIAGISGTSAGALNGAALKAGMVRGGRDGARASLEWLWREVAGLRDISIPDWMRAWLPDPGIVSRTVQYSLPFATGEAVGRMLSPYAWGPLYQNPLERIIERLDFGEICAQEGPEFFVCATSVRDGKVRVFEGDRLCPQAILASACLPTLFQSVELEDPETGEIEAFWDGGYTGNPALFPLFRHSLPDDLLIVNINPIERPTVPVTPPEIQNRINEISFNSSLLRELRAIEFVQRLIEAGSIKDGAMKKLRVHMVSDDALMTELSVATKLVPLPSIISQLRQAGRAAADGFLAEHGASLGVRQTADLRAMFT
ncbi:MAG: patatin [Rhodobacteraceae bacterium]|jgi:NTE family protein|uniref:NTE family protein n=1 Tax=Salipiger profundus TaxID=1229727 RepID=A0A1U7D7P5_9RHOB|nr:MULTISPECIES: patatin-like phospholipase family protein [Salipiger]APX24197.1 NTE family protein [Salipiger profundus]MAB07387.1 patatin [Paracoccaceae bacterium]GFZ95308.1 alpha/beta hydrolase [Salipiger profundus]SFB88089.1 NTE family protein [Salipiger profundus]